MLLKPTKVFDVVLHIYLINIVFHLWLVYKMSGVRFTVTKSNGKDYGTSGNEVPNVSIADPGLYNYLLFYNVFFLLVTWLAK